MSIRTIPVSHEELLRALRVVDEIHNLSTAVYEVCEDVNWEEEQFDGSNWDHPIVKRYLAAVAILNLALEQDEVGYVG